MPRFGFTDVVKQHGKLLTAQTHSNVQWAPCRVLQQAAYALQHVVAGLVTVVVVVGFEVINIAEQQRQAALFALRLTPEALELAVETAAVVQAGQAIVIGQYAHQPADQKMLARLELQQVTPYRAHQVAKQ